MRNGHADIASYRGIGEVSLQPRNRKFGGQMFQNRIGDTEIALRIFEVDGIHLMGAWWMIRLLLFLICCLKYSMEI